MKKIYSLLAIMLVITMLFCTACDFSGIFNPKPQESTTTTTTTTTVKPNPSHDDNDNDGICDECKDIFGEAVAKIGDVYFTSLELAIAAAKADETIVLLTDVTFAEVITIIRW